MTSTRLALHILLVTGGTSLLVGCAHDYTVEPTFGVSVSQAIQRQTITPGGVGVDGVSPGLDGDAAKATIDRYQKSYTSPERLGNVMTLGVGSGSTTESMAGASER
jgi:hypothetical protein